ncbi:MAG TPA: bifunctional DNA-formamidopyrimidine glycosylase/DNA-(apurinic or apyrimidinic site) lyase [Parvularculaceae bacterium]|nr:bifunctional DNA-formamidopyrimidine glycosylase/DNA-(apurinic or apyrimidinic site) lyase [Parvularculaceae bacterium]
MPELPEVETVRRGLAPAMEGATFSRVELRRPDLRFPLPQDFARRLSGARVESLGRRGKYLVASLSTGESLIMHLGMSGRFTVERGSDRAPVEDNRALGPEAPPDPRHDHVIFEMAGRGAGARIVFNDPRRFGFMDLVEPGGLETASHFAGMGPEPLSETFTPERFNATLKGRSAPIKAALLDQHVVAGVGNIYACEALFRAGISPRRKAASVAGARGARLHGAIRAVLEEAIEAGGSTLRDFADASGGRGYFQHNFDVYDREGRPCPACGTSVRRIVQSGRSTFLCPACQR